MANGKSKAIWSVFGILVFLGILYWVYKRGYLVKYGIGTLRITAEGEESLCNDTGNDPEGRSTSKSSGCFPPVAPHLYLVFQGGDKGDVKEREFTGEEMSWVKDIFDGYIHNWDSPGEVLIEDKYGKEVSWYYNQKRVDPNIGTEYYLFVDNISYRNWADYPKQS